LRLQPKVGYGPKKQPSHLSKNLPNPQFFCMVEIKHLDVSQAAEHVPQARTPDLHMVSPPPAVNEQESHDAGSDHVGGSGILQRAKRKRVGDAVAAVVVIFTRGLSVPMLPAVLLSP
jgi:hypothetical protein